MEQPHIILEHCKDKTTQSKFLRAQTLGCTQRIIELNRMKKEMQIRNKSKGILTDTKTYLSSSIRQWINQTINHSNSLQVMIEDEAYLNDLWQRAVCSVVGDDCPRSRLSLSQVLWCHQASAVCTKHYYHQINQQKGLNKLNWVFNGIFK